ncbi:4-deoxy-L-threo-5-hexosulose-uronate ketol-isomerase|nr:4-deoxy-L-threo-5-hexosulose-uronate ketol-isomerase [Candidatus Pantoea persica]
MEVDGKVWEIGTEEALYIGKGAQALSFSSSDAQRPAKFYFNSAPAHGRFPDKKIGKEEAVRTTLGDLATSNRRTINKYLVPGAANLPAHHRPDPTRGRPSVEHHALSHP